MEATVVDCISNVTCCRQFVGISSSRRGYFTVSYCQRSGSHCRFQLIFSSSTTAGNCRRIPSFIGQSSYSTSITINFYRITTSSRSYSNAVAQLKANLVVFYSGNNVAITGIFNCLGQFNGVRSTIISRNLESFFFQIMQLPAVHRFFAACSNGTVSHVTQSNRATRRTTYQVHLVAWGAGGVA